MMNYMSRTNNTCLPALKYIKPIHQVKLILVIKKNYKFQIQSHRTGMFCQMKDLAVNDLRTTVKLRL